MLFYQKLFGEMSVWQNVLAPTNISFLSVSIMQIKMLFDETLFDEMSRWQNDLQPFSILNIIWCDKLRNAACWQKMIRWNDRLIEWRGSYSFITIFKVSRLECLFPSEFLHVSVTRLGESLIFRLLFIEPIFTQTSSFISWFVWRFQK